ncbi:hypothetical protein QUF70_06470 [Desulfobacterales bacterium HSG17]|nr:hypothetical protein [Desulfobacterales bacterium HSG17]
MYAPGISITDLTLNDFRMDLSEYMKENLKKLAVNPANIFSVGTIDNNPAIQESGAEPGVIFCLKDEEGRVLADSSNALSPYYLVYVKDNGDIQYNFIRSKRVLDILKKQCIGKKQVDTDAVKVFNRDTDQGKDMSRYLKLLETAVNNIAGKSEEKGVESLFSRGGTVLSKDSFQGMDDVEVIAYMILKPGEDK